MIAIMPEESTNDARPPGPVHIVPARSHHTHTAILLHGRGSDGAEFAEELFTTRLSDGSSLADKLPGWRWVFPSSKASWSSTFQDYIHSWFEAPSLSDPELGQDMQIPGIMDSCHAIESVLETEISDLHEKTENLIFGGISQGGAVAMWMLLCRGTDSQVGAFFAASTWLPFAKNIERLLANRDTGEACIAIQDAVMEENDEVIIKNLDDTSFKRRGNRQRSNMKVFLGHGTDDAYVDVELGRQASHVLSTAGFDVEWKEYSGAEQEGHWLQEPNQMDDIHLFMLKSMV